MMRCHVCLPDSHILEVEVDLKATGQQCLDKVCERLGVLETDYLGLRYYGNKQEQLWLNLRNRVEQQVPGHQPYRFQLRLKFCVQPHCIQQETTRHLYFHQVWEDLKAGQLHLQGQEERTGKLVALVAQALYGNPTTNIFQPQVYDKLLHDLRGSAAAHLADTEAVAREHQLLMDVSRVSAEYRLLQEVSQLPTFGVEFHEVRSAHGQKILFGVGPEGLLLKNTAENVQEHLPYPQIHMATHRDREIFVQLMDDAGELLPAEGYKLISRKAAVALYRCITEMHSFYRCDTVSGDVANQFCRDLKGTLVSIFNENSDLGKSYIFDIKRTSREAYDHARRKLHSMSQSTQSLTSRPCHGSVHSMDIDNHNHTNHNHSHYDCSSPDCQEIKERLENLEDTLLCCICMTRFIGAVLSPCGHMTCCHCAHKISECPLCRTSVERRQKVFIPNFPTHPVTADIDTPEEEEDCAEMV